MSAADISQNFVKAAFKTHLHECATLLWLNPNLYGAIKNAILRSRDEYANFVLFLNNHSCLLDTFSDNKSTDNLSRLFLEDTSLDAQTFDQFAISFKNMNSELNKFFNPHIRYDDLFENMTRRGFYLLLQLFESSPRHSPIVASTNPNTEPKEMMLPQKSPILFSGYNLRRTSARVRSGMRFMDLNAEEETQQPGTPTNQFI